MTTPIPPHTELRMRQCGEAVWNATCAHDPDITPKQAFTEGHYIGMASGVLACRQVRMECKLRIRQLEAERAAVFAVGLLALAAAVVLGAGR
jgi:hypothetical protein